jgi:hypothetical protein
VYCPDNVSLRPGPLPIGATVRLRWYPNVTGVVVGHCIDIDRTLVRWDDTDEITQCLKAMLERAP